MATYTQEDFRNRAMLCADEYEIDRLCLTWLKMAAMDKGGAGDAASKLLDVVEDLLDL